jgi:prevent-host-death family protein
MKNIVGLKELRQNVSDYIAEVKKGKSFIVVRRSKPIFKISPPEEAELWEPVADFTKIKKGGVPLKNLLAHL